VSILIGDGSGNFTATTSYPVTLPVSIAIGDFNADAKLDLAVANGRGDSAPSTVSILLGNGDGTFNPAVTYPAGRLPQNVVAADFSGDGKLDLAVATTALAILTGNGDGTFATPNVYGTLGDSQNWDLAVADVNGDGKLDTALANNSGASVVLGNGNGTFSQARADLNRDLQSDVVWLNASSGDVAVWLMNGPLISSGSLVTRVSDANWKIAGSGDFDGDGNADIFWSHELTGHNVVWLMHGTTINSAAFVTSAPEANWKIAGVADFNKDGKADLFWRRSATGQSAVWLMNGTLLLGAFDLPSMSDLNWTTEGFGDFDADGVPDVFWRNTATGEDAIWFMTGRVGNANIGPSTSRSSSAVAMTISNLDYRVVAAGDLDGDGKADLVWFNSATGDVAVWLMDGSAIRVPGLVGTVNDLNWQIEGIGDFDGDGKADLIWRKTNSGDVAVWLMDGVSLKQPAYITQVNDLNWSIAAPR